MTATAEHEAVAIDRHELGGQLEVGELRAGGIPPRDVLAVGRDDPLLSQNEALSRLLWSKNVWHALRIWDGFAHDWPVWAQMLPLYVGGHD